MRSLNDILADCRVAFSGLTESEKASNAEALVGKNAMSGFLALMNSSETDINKLRGAIENCDGASESMAETMQKTEQKTEQQAGLGMSFCEEEGRITVFRKTLEALEWPSHYRFLYNRKMKQIAVQACGAEESGAHRVGKPDESNSGEIKCMALVRMIYGDSGWDKKMSYRLIGRAFPQQRLVSFKITDAMQIENGRVLTEM